MGLPEEVDCGADLWVAPKLERQSEEECYIQLVKHDVWYTRGEIFRVDVLDDYGEIPTKQEVSLEH